MTTRKHLKRLVRLRVAQTGELYSNALRKIRQNQEDRMSNFASTDAIAHCSFCSKPNVAVERLIAAPGVFICNECVALSAAIVEDTANATPEESLRRRSQYAERPIEDILASLSVLVQREESIEAELMLWVGQLRDRGTSWLAIADAMGMSVSAARRRFEISED